MDEQDYKRLKREVEEAKDAAARAEGALQETLGRLHSEFGCTTTKEAKKLLEQLKAEADTAEKEFNQAVKDYERHTNMAQHKRKD